MQTIFGGTADGTAWRAANGRRRGTALGHSAAGMI
tara:strand:- start:4972 stop:5076 length:105 start_codon:yes stop_codon:yes gene_type:complete